MCDARDIQQVLARFVRAIDRQDGASLRALFIEDGRVEIFLNRRGAAIAMSELLVQQISRAMGSETLGIQPEGWSHHTTHDPIIEIAGDGATIDAQFIVFRTVGTHSAKCGQHSHGHRHGTVRPIQSGYYRAELNRTESGWKIAVQRITLDLPAPVAAHFQCEGVSS